MSSSVPLATLVVLGVLALFSCSEPEPPATALPAATALPVPTSTITPFPTLTPTPIPTLEPMLPIRVHQYITTLQVLDRETASEYLMSVHTPVRMGYTPDAIGY